MKTFRSILMIIFLSLFFLVPVHADNTEYVRDDYGLLDSAEVTALNTQAETVSKKYSVGVYIRIMPDRGSQTIENYAESIYSDESLGIGSSRECIVLVIAMSDHSFDIMGHGSKANTAFTDYGKDELGQEVVSYLSDGSYNSGFQYFIQECGSYLASSQAGSPVDVPSSQRGTSASEAAQHAATMKYVRYGVTFIGAPLLALIICLIIKAKNKTAGIKYEASSYVPKGGMNLTGMQDIFLYRTQTVTHINRGGGGGHGGGTSINGGGFSHSSGHF